MENDKKISSKLQFLDSLRGIAAIVVVIGHFHVGFAIDQSFFGPYNFMSYLINYTILYGNFAVCLFFVLSGFVLSLHFFRTNQNEILVKQSIKRYPRLFLPVLATSFLYWMVQKYGFFANQEVVKITASSWFSGFWVESYSFKQLVLRCGYDLMFFNEQTFCNNINTSLWTMPIELKCSFLLFASLFLIRNVWILMGYNLLIIFSIFIFKLPINEFYFPFLLGLNIAYFYLKGFPLIINHKLLYVLLFFIILFGNIPFQDFLFPPAFGTPVRCLSAAVLIVIVLYNQQVQAVLVNKVLLFLGEISFSLYLIHALVLGTISSYLFLYLHHQGVHYQINYAISLLITIAFSILLGKIVHDYIDKPSIKIAHWTYALVAKIYNKLFFKQ